MPKNENQKLKLLYLARILHQRTDEDHSLSMGEILRILQEEYGIIAERKSIYRDIASLREFGMDIEMTASRTPGYYMASRNLELTELKLLVDAVQSSKFITHKKSAELIRKLSDMTSTHEARKLSRQVFVAGRVKTMNESIYYTVDHLHRAMQENRTITFQYFSWNMKKEKVLRHGGKIYHVSPWALTWEDENYYLLAYDGEANAVKYFRVDKILHVDVTDQPRLGGEHFADFDTAEFSKKVFGMYGGEEQLVVLRCRSDLAGAILDQFGTDVSIRPGEDSFTVAVRVIVSPQFLGWIAAFGDGIVIESPTDVQGKMQTLLQSAAAAYEK